MFRVIEQMDVRDPTAINCLTDAEWRKRDNGRERRGREGKGEGEVERERPEDRCTPRLLLHGPLAKSELLF